MTYQPTARRPIAAIFRWTADAAVEICRRFQISADAVSYASIVAAALAAVAFQQSGETPWLLVPAVLLCVLRLWLNMLDGMVALALGQASRRGELLNDLPDRVSDVLIFVGVAHSGLCHPLLGYWAAIFSLLTAYIGTFGQAVGAGRQFGGWMSKPWRMVVLGVGAWITLALQINGANFNGIAGLTVLDLAHCLVIVGCLQTVTVRLQRILAALERAKATL